MGGKFPQIHARCDLLLENLNTKHLILFHYNNRSMCIFLLCDCLNRCTWKWCYVGLQPANLSLRRCRTLGSPSRDNKANLVYTNFSITTRLDCALDPSKCKAEFHF